MDAGKLDDGTPWARLYCDRCLCSTRHRYVGPEAQPYFDGEWYRYDCTMPG